MGDNLSTLLPDSVGCTRGDATSVGVSDIDVNADESDEGTEDGNSDCSDVGTEDGTEETLVE